MVELARAYSAFATYGSLVEPYFIDRVVDRGYSTLPDLQEGVRTRHGALVVSEFDPAVDRQDDIGVLGAAGPFDLLVDDHVDLRQAVDDDVVGPLGLVDQVSIVVPDELCGAGEVSMPSKQLPALLGGVNDQRSVTSAPEGDLLPHSRVAQVLVRDACVLVHHRVERIFVRVRSHPGTGPW